MGFEITSAMLVLGALGLLFGIGLAIASKIFFVHKDARVLEIEAVLPGANCGACGAPGCAGFAEGVVNGEYSVSACTAGGAEIAKKIAAIMGTQADEMIPNIAVVCCRGNHENAVDRALYQGIQDCKAATLIDNGHKGCVYGCLGLGSCVKACPFNALVMRNDGLPHVIEHLCTGCGACVTACPRQIMKLMPVNQTVYLGCVSRDFGKAVKAVCKVGCIGCSMCSKEKITPNEIITMDGHLPVINYGKVQNPGSDLQNAVEKCPTKSFAVRENSESGSIHKKAG